MTKLIPVPKPTPEEIEHVLADMVAGTSVYGHWVLLDRERELRVILGVIAGQPETIAPTDETAEKERLTPTLWWVSTHNVSGEDFYGGGHTFAEATAVAWVNANVGAWWANDDDVFAGDDQSELGGRMTQEVYLSCPRRVPDNWVFEIHEAPANAMGSVKVQ
jgi:hypothetical protein